jgi:4-hydroxy-tetrahydrodipicolinate reductase
MKKIRVMVAGMSMRAGNGKLAQLIAEAILASEDMSLYPFALSEDRGTVMFGKSFVNLVPISKHRDCLKRAKKRIDLIVDCTQPKAVNVNAELYCDIEVPFVMMTTGGDRKKLVKTVKNSKISALITTNAAAQVVVVLEMLKFAAKKFPGAFKGFSRLFHESHQAGKKDPSGTMVGALDFFAALLGTPVSKDEIKMVRDPVVQELELGVPKKYLGGHGFHAYTLMSPDGTIMVQLKHNLLGRSAYVDGALMDIRFLARHKREKGKVFSQVDPLRKL